jgi:hypothetical protein
MSFSRFIIGLIIFATMLPSATALAQPDNQPVAGSVQVNPEILRIQEEAQGHFTKAFGELDDEEYLETALIIEDLVRDYGDDPFVEDAYFYLADIYTARLQDEEYFDDAIRVLGELIRRRPGSDKCLDAQLKIANIHYRDRYDLEAAISALEEYFDMLPRYPYLESEKLQGQILLAKCYQKLGSFSAEKKVWDGLAVTNPAADRTGRLRFLNEIDDWKRIAGDRVTLFFHVGVAERSYKSAYARADAALADMIGTFGRELPCPVEVYLYTDAEDVAAYASIDEALALDRDREIHISTDQLDEMEYLAAYIYAGVLNSRARDEKYPLMRGGFEMAFYSGPGGEDIDQYAARHLLLFDESPRSSIFLRESTFFGSSEYERLAGSFCSYLIENEPVDAFMHLYRGLYPWHDADMVEAAFERHYRKSMDDVVAAWYSSLEPAIAEARSAVDAIDYDLSPVKVDLSTPDAALASWYEAMRKGDFDALMASSAPELRDLFLEAKQAYEEHDILEEVMIEEFVYPYYSTRYRVVNEGSLGGDIYIFKIEIVKDDEVIEDKNITLRKIGGKWFIDMNR